MRTRIVWSVAGLTVVLAILDVLITAQYRDLFSEEAVAQHGFPFVSGATVGSAVLGAAIVSRAGRHPIGWLLLLVGSTGALSLMAEAYSLWVLDADGPGPTTLGSISGWIASLIGGQLAIAGLALMFLLAPDGHLLSRRWRFAVGALLVGALACTGTLLTLNPTTYDFTSNDIGILRQVVYSVGFLLITAGVIASGVSIVLRLRRSHGVQRQQLRLIAAGAVLIAVGIAALLLVQMFNGGEQTWAASLPLYVGYFLLPILIGTAVLRYRLYDVEVILNRAVVLAIGTAFAAVGYILLVVVVGSQLDTRTGGFWLSLLGTAAVAIAFQPLRRSVVRAANRLAYGPRAQPYEELSQFNRRLVETPTPATLLPAVAQAAAQAVSARGATVTMAVSGIEPLTAQWGQEEADATEAEVVPINQGGATLGSIAVSLPRGRELRPSDVRLLEALADQAAVAFRNAALETQLAGHVAELDRTTRQIADSRARIVAADDAVRRTLEESISRDVAPHLVRVAGELDRVSHETAVSADDIGTLVTSVNTALEALRDLTRGVFPTQLSRSGIEPALKSLLGRERAAVTVRVDPSAAGRRFPARVETAVYFCCAEVSRAADDPQTIELTLVGDDLLLLVDGVPGAGIDLQGISDRIEAAGGQLTAESGRLTVTIPGVAEGAPATSGAGQGPGL
ncbi:MAG: GAF domain-containing protein [Nocardioides sp.]